MKKVYPTGVGKLCLTLGLIFLIQSVAHAQIVTYDTTFDGWNAVVTEDLSLHGNDSAPGIIFFPGIGQQTKNINDLLVNGPHYLIANKMWDGSVTLGNGVHHPFIISLQPPAPGSAATVVKPKIDAILARYRIKRRSLYFTALSQGSWQANEFLAYEATPGDHSYGSMVRAMVNLEGVEPSDNTGVAAAYPNKMGHWAKACGGRELWVEGSQDWRDMQAGAQNMMDSVPGSATYFQVNYGGGAHCCWNTEYEPSVTWTKGSNSNISQVVGNQVPMNVWQWLLRQGDTSMPSGAPAAPAAPTANAGTPQTLTLPTSSVNLTGSGTGNGGAKVSSMSWAQTAGPNKANLKVGNLVAAVGNIVGVVLGNTMNLGVTISGLAAGQYTFQLTVKDNTGKTSASTVSVAVNAAAPAPPAAPATKPNVSAGNAPTITLPSTTVTLNGSAAGSNGAKIKGVVWQESQGPVTAKIGSPSSLSTAVSGLTAAGSYVFRLTVTDQNGKQSAAVVTVVVNPAPVAAKTPPPAVSAGQGQTITLPSSTVTLKGTATGESGATIKGLTWKQSQGPAGSKISSPASISTAVSGLTAAGSYVYTLTATDSKGQQSSASMTVVVNAAKPTVAAPAPASPKVSAGANQSITLPATSLTLYGSATGSNGARITAAAWQQSLGPVTANIGSPSAIVTTISGLRLAGSYVFRLTVTDQNKKQAAAVVTVVVKAAAAPAVKTPSPTVTAGQGQKIALPTSSTTLKGVTTGNDGATIKGLTWKQGAGPVTAKIGSPNSISTAVSGLTAAGNYVFTLTATDSKGMSANGSVTVTVETEAAKALPAAPAAPEAKIPPTVSAGANQTITLPTNSITLKGSAAGRNGAVVNSYFWMMMSGPGWVSFANEWAPSTTVSGLTAGTYVFELAASDNEDQTASATVTVVVKAKPAGAEVGGNAAIGNATIDPSAADSINHESGLVIYPNPVHDLLNIHLNSPSTGKVIVAIFNMSGTRLQSQELDKESWSLQTSVDVSRLAAGMYVLEVLNGPSLPTIEKFIKQ